MSVAYSQDLRDRILLSYDQGMQTSEIAALFHVSESWTRRVRQRRDQSGEVAPRPRGGARIIKIDLAQLEALYEQQPDATTAELHRRLGIACSESAVGAALQRLGLTYKKRRSTPRNRTVPTSPRPAHAGKKTNPLSPKNA